jgi:hypothetical protein
MAGGGFWVRMRLGRELRARVRVVRGLRVRVRLGRVYGRKGRALRIEVRLGRELQARVRVVRGLRGQVRLGRACKRSGRARKSPGKARKSNTAPLAIEKSLLRTSASSLRIMHTGNGTRKRTGSGKQSKRELFPLARRL